MRNPLLTLFLTFVMACMTLPAHAYLDPATGSMILQLVLGGVAGAVVIVKLYWSKLLGIFGLGKNEDNDSSEA